MSLFAPPCSPRTKVDVDGPGLCYITGNDGALKAWAVVKRREGADEHGCVVLARTSYNCGPNHVSAADYAHVLVLRGTRFHQVVDIKIFDQGDFLFYNFTQNVSHFILLSVKVAYERREPDWRYEEWKGSGAGAKLGELQVPGRVQPPWPMQPTGCPVWARTEDQGNQS